MYGSAGEPQRRTVALGRVKDTTEEQARKALAGLIDKDTEQHSAVVYINATTKPVQRRSVRPTQLTSQKMGAVAEYLVAVDLMERGFNVYRAMEPSAACDLMICDAAGDYKLRVEVKCACFRKDRTPYVDVKRNAGKFDVLAVVMADGEIRYATHNQIGIPRVLFQDACAGGSR